MTLIDIKSMGLLLDCETRITVAQRMISAGKLVGVLQRSPWLRGPEHRALFHWGVVDYVLRCAHDNRVLEVRLDDRYQTFVMAEDGFWRISGDTESIWLAVQPSGPPPILFMGLFVPEVVARMRTDSVDTKRAMLSHIRPHS